MKKPNNLLFFVLDGRAAYDPNAAEVMDMLEETTCEEVWNEYVTQYRDNGYDYILAVYEEYESERGSTCQMLQTVFSLDELLDICND